MSGQAPEQVQFQVVASNRHGQLRRPFETTFGTIEVANAKALEALDHPDCTEVFVCTVHSAYKKTYTVERTL